MKNPHSEALTNISGRVLKAHGPRRGTALALFWVGVAMSLLGLMAIVVAEIFMPENEGGRSGLIAFYRAFGPFVLALASVAAGCFLYLRIGLLEQVHGE